MSTTLLFVVGIFFIVVAILISKFLLIRSIDANWCREQYINFVDEKINKKIDAINAKAFKLASLFGLIAGVGLGVLLWIFLPVKFWLSLLRIVGLILLLITVSIVIAFLIVNEYCVKHFGKMIAFVEMVNIASTLKESREDYVIADTESNYGRQYLRRLGLKLNRNVKITIWLYSIFGALAGYAGGVGAFYLITEKIGKSGIWAYVAWIVIPFVILYLANSIGKEYCVMHYGCKAVDYQLHIDLLTIKYAKTSKVQDSNENKEEISGEPEIVIEEKTEAQIEQKNGEIK